MAESSLPIFPYFFIICLPTTRKMGSSQQRNLGTPGITCHSESRGVRFILPFCISCRAQAPQEFSGEEAAISLFQQRAGHPNHLWHLVPTSGRSQISAVHPSRSKGSARTDPNYHTTYKCQHQLGFASDLLRVLLNYLLAGTHGGTCRQPLLPLHCAILGFHTEDKYVQKPKPSHCNL